VKNELDDETHRASEARNRRLDSWKAIGAFFGKDERTVRRWEAERGLPVRRVPGAGRSSVFAYESELAEWLRNADISPAAVVSKPEPQNGADDPEGQPTRESGKERPSTISSAPPLKVLAAALVLVVIGTAWFLHNRHVSTETAEFATAGAGTRRAATPEAQERYLRGLYYWNKRTRQDLNQALDNFTQSIVQDPKYAPSYVGLANCYNLLREYSMMPPEEAYPRAIAAAKRAIELDDTLAEAHTSLAFGEFYWLWDPPAAEREFQRAIELDPKSVLAHHWYATFLMVLGRADQALMEIEKARELDPRSSAILADEGMIFFSRGDLAEAVPQLKAVENAEPEFLSPHIYLAEIYLEGGDNRGYLREAKKSAQLLGDDGQMLLVSAAKRGLLASGRNGMLEEMLQAQEKLHEQGKVQAYELAQTRALLGEPQAALEKLRVAVDGRESRVIAIRVDKKFKALHADEEFRALIAKVGLPPLDSK
jgi:Tfp pilus assembly protein PilF